MIGELQYLMLTRLDIANVVEILLGFKKIQIETHYIAVKGVFRYLKGTL